MLAGVGQAGDATVGETHLLGPTKNGGVAERGSRDLRLELDDLADVLQEPGIDAGERVDRLCGEAGPVGIAEGEQAVRGWDAQQPA